MAQMQFLSDNLLVNGLEFFVGLEYDIKSDRYATKSGTPAADETWAIGEPNRLT